MSPISHALLPLLIGRSRMPTRPDGAPRWSLSAVIALAGVSPDLLYPHLSLEDRHAALSHSLLAWVAFALLLLAICAIFPPVRRHRATAALCAGAYLLHIACDFVTGGVPLFAPLISGVWGDAWLPLWAWLVLDGVVLVNAYLVYRWLPLRRRMSRPARSGGSDATS